MTNKRQTLIERIAGDSPEDHNIDYLMDEVAVHEPHDRDSAIEIDPNHPWPKGWYAVSTPNESIVAYFYDEHDAYRFRLDLINRALNP